MTKSVKCPECNLYYNSHVYAVCPHCKATGIIEHKAAEKPAEPPRVSSEPPMEAKAEAEAEIETRKESAGPKRLTMSYGQMQAKQAPRREQPEEPAVKTEPEQPQPQKNDPPQQSESCGESLREQLKKSSKTVGKFTSASGSTVDPVVGWVVGVKGVYFGRSFPLHSGKNRMGRSQEFDVRLLEDASVSRACVASIVFDAKAGVFSIIPGDSDSLCYVNGEALYERRPLTGYEQIELGDSEKNMFVFVPFCGEHFSWLAYQAAE